MYVRTDHTGNLRITPGKLYEVKKSDLGTNLYEIELNDGNTGLILFTGCAHLDGRDWEVVPSPDYPTAGTEEISS